MDDERNSTKDATDGVGDYVGPISNLDDDEVGPVTNVEDEVGPISNLND